MSNYQPTFEICPYPDTDNNKEIISYYTPGLVPQNDSGIDIFVPEDIIVPPNAKGFKIKHNINVRFTFVNKSNKDIFKMAILIVVMLAVNTYTSMLNYKYEATIFINYANFVLAILSCIFVFTRILDFGFSPGYYIYPRSSMGSKTPLRMSNSTGIMDSGYRGNVIGLVDNLSNEPYEIKKGTRLFQLCAPGLANPEVKLVESLDETERGSGGFGSTDDKINPHH